jgi:hypothetical protein
MEHRVQATALHTMGYGVFPHATGSQLLTRRQAALICRDPRNLPIPRDAHPEFRSTRRLPKRD